MKFFGKPIINGTLVSFDCSHVPPDEFESFRNQFAISGLAIIEIKKANAKSQSRSYEQLKLWWDIVNAILTFYKIPISTESKEAYSEYLKNTYLPEKVIVINGIEMPVPKSVSDKTNWETKDFSEFIEAILFDFRQEGVEFNVDKKSYASLY